MQDPKNLDTNKFSDLSNSAYMEDLSVNLDEMEDVDDNELKEEILESKTQFVQIPEANQSFRETRELLQESKFVMAHNQEQLPSRAEYVNLPMHYGQEHPNMHMYHKNMMNPGMYMQESQQIPLQSDNTFVHVSLAKEKKEEKLESVKSEEKEEENKEDKPEEKEPSEKEEDKRDYEAEIAMLTEDLNNCRRQFENEIDKVADKEEKNKQLQDQVTQLSNQVQSNNDVMNEQRNIINRLEVEKEAMEERIRMIQSHDETLTTTKVEGLERDNNRLMNEVQDKNQLLRDKELMIERLNEEVFNLQKGQSNDIKSLELELHKNQLTVENLNKQQDQLLKMVDELKQDLSNARHKNRELEANYYAQNDTNHRLNAELEYSRNQIQVLKGQLNNSSSNMQNMSMQWEKAMKEIPANLENKMKMFQSEVERRYVVPNMNTDPQYGSRNLHNEPQRSQVQARNEPQQPLNPYSFEDNNRREPARNEPIRDDAFNRNFKRGDENKTNKYELNNLDQRRNNARRGNRMARHHHKTNRQDDQSNFQTSQQHNTRQQFNERNQPSNNRFNQQDDDMSMRVNNNNNSVRNEGLVQRTHFGC